MQPLVIWYELQILIVCNGYMIEESQRSARRQVSHWLEHYCKNKGHYGQMDLLWLRHIIAVLESVES